MRIKLVPSSVREPCAPGLYQCRGCKWVFYHADRDRWSNVLFDETGDLFNRLDKLKYTTWEDWQGDYADCVRSLVRIVG